MHRKDPCCSNTLILTQLRHLQNKLHHIDERYKEGCVTESHMKGDPYEEEGQAAVADVSNSFYH
jgi:hypothetical protein